MPDEPDPPRKVYGFKARDFKRDNAPASVEPPLPTAKELAMLAGTSPVDPSRRKAAPTAKASDPNDVYTVLRENRASAAKHGLNEVEIKKIKSRRKRDFWLVLVGGNLAIIGAVVLTSINVVTVIFGLAGLIVFSLSVSWIMWQVMDRY
ncbi:MAG TPA: hypothetical protein VIM71_03215 [Lacunisphaera sp.]